MDFSFAEESGLSFGEFAAGSSAPTTGIEPNSLHLPPLQDLDILKASESAKGLELHTSCQREEAVDLKERTPHARRLAQTWSDNTTPHSAAIQPAYKRTQDGVDQQRLPGKSSPQTLRKILDDVPVAAKAPITSRHQLGILDTDDFFHLPQIPQKQLRTQPQIVPPIIIPLYEPPPQNAVFPPIAPHVARTAQPIDTEEAWPDVAAEDATERSKTSTAPTTALDISASQTDAVHIPVKKTKARKLVQTRRKWTSEETQQLLLGVKKYGAGRWTSILADGAFVFNQRSAVDLKDRFRTCCPKRLFEQPFMPAAASGCISVAKLSQAQAGPTCKMPLSDIICDSSSTDKQDAKPRKTSRVSKARLHRKASELEAVFGPDQSFRLSKRRNRRLFSAEEDKKILEGYMSHGSNWTQIVKDPVFAPTGRKPTDIRDRMRNKYPEQLRSSKPQMQESSHPSSSVPSAKQLSNNVGPTQITKAHTFNTEPAMNRPLAVMTDIFHSHVPPEQSFSTTLDLVPRDPVLPLETCNLSKTSMTCSSLFEWVETSTIPFSNGIGDMDIARFLLDDSWAASAASTYISKPRIGETLDHGSLLQSMGHVANMPHSMYNILIDTSLSSSGGLV